MRSCAALLRCSAAAKHTKRVWERGRSVDFECMSSCWTPSGWWTANEAHRLLAHMASGNEIRVLAYTILEVGKDDAEEFGWELENRETQRVEV